MTRRWLVLPLTLALLPAAAASADPVSPLTLTRIASTTPELGAAEGRAEIAAFHAGTDRLFVTNVDSDALDVYDLANPAAPAFLDSIDLTPYGSPNSVAARPDGLVAVAVEAPVKTDDGTVQFFDAASLARLGDAPAGALPDMLTFTPDGYNVLVANEGEPSDDYSIDPEGSVTIVDVSGGGGAATARQVRFAPGQSYPGVRIFGPDANAAEDFEPEYVSVHPNGMTAYVSLQENNAIAIVDIVNARVKRVQALGFKSWAKSGMDPSDRDGIEVLPRPRVFGMYQPDALATYRTGGRFFTVAANEGDVRSWGTFNEEASVSDLELDPGVFPDAATLQTDTELGRLKVTNTMGDVDSDDDYDKLFAFGGRSLSVLDVAGRVIYDTGDGIEELTATQGFFNSNHGSSVNIDNRSDDKGPEPEGVAVGKVGDHRYAFLGHERESGISVWDLSAERGKALPAGYTNSRALTPSDRGPEGILFVTAADSPTGAPLVLATNEITGTVGIYSVAQP